MSNTLRWEAQSLTIEGVKLGRSIITPFLYRYLRRRNLLCGIRREIGVEKLRNCDRGMAVRCGGLHGSVHAKPPPLLAVVGCVLHSKNIRWRCCCRIHTPPLNCIVPLFFLHHLSLSIIRTRSPASSRRLLLKRHLERENILSFQLFFLIHVTRPISSSNVRACKL